MVMTDNFTIRVETVLVGGVGSIIGRSILKSGLARINKQPDAFTQEDRKTLIESLIKSISVFGTREEAKRIQAELEKLI